jgi:hypothetical protein
MIIRATVIMIIHAIIDKWIDMDDHSHTDQWIISLCRRLSYGTGTVEYRYGVRYHLAGGQTHSQPFIVITSSLRQASLRLANLANPALHTPLLQALLEHNYTASAIQLN